MPKLIRLKDYDKKNGQVHRTYQIGRYRFIAGGEAVEVDDEAVILKLSEMQASSPKAPLMFEVKDKPEGKPGARGPRAKAAAAG